MERYQPCPKCASEKAELISFTWWGGIVGPKMFTHVKCTQCGTTYNGKTGKSNQTAIAIYVAVSTVVAIFIVTALSPSRQQNNPSTSSISSQDFDSPLETLRERVAISSSIIDRL
jgi:predicted nucleic-acid-binding Zn-ribbon protein